MGARRRVDSETRPHVEVTDASHRFVLEASQEPWTRGAVDP